MTLCSTRLRSVRDTVLAARADHLRDGVMREAPRDLVAALLRRHGEQQARDAPVHVEQHQAPDLLIRPAQAPGQFAQERHAHPRGGAKLGLEVLPAKGQ
jgi:hypothetical protein